jgi:hypothetical protein
MHGRIDDDDETFAASLNLLAKIRGGEMPAKIGVRDGQPIDQGVALNRDGHRGRGRPPDQALPYRKGDAQRLAHLPQRVRAIILAQHWRQLGEHPGLNIPPELEPPWPSRGTDDDDKRDAEHILSRLPPRDPRHPDPAQLIRQGHHQEAAYEQLHREIETFVRNLQKWAKEP